MLPRRNDYIDCEFCGSRMCEFFAEIDASNLIRASVVAHFSRCTSWPPTFSDEVFLTYCALLVEAQRRKRALRSADYARRQAPAISGEWPC